MACLYFNIIALIFCNFFGSRFRGILIFNFFFQDAETDFVDSQRPGLHISTFLRQLTFDVLYVVEYIILLSFGLLAKVEEFQGEEYVFVTIILVLSLSSLVLR